ncbi:hypothetical protein ACFRAO_16605 [Streptomyces sp. NPDC056656]|uniref:hypothetical protein n=1 Tax=Streptomyces sp. NPDC056656 TaxID=3345895 RepID=UPI0036C4669C
MKSGVRRAVAAAAVVAALGVTTACGGSSETTDDAKKPAKPAASEKTTAPAKPAEEGAKALTAAELEKAVVATGDVKGYKVEKVGKGDLPPTESVAAKPASCQPLADMFMFSTRPTAKDRVVRTLMATDELDPKVTSLALLAHDGADAAKVMKDLRTASKSCTAYEHVDYKYSGVKERPAPDAGDEAVSYDVKGVIDGDKVPMTFTVVRSGSTVVAFYTMNMLDASKTDVPQVIVDAQLAKLEKTA